MDGEKIYIADKLTLDKILALLTGTETGLAVLKNLIKESADAAGETADRLQEIDKAVDAVGGYLSNDTYGLNAIKTELSGRANESTVTAVKTLLENGTYGLNALKTAISGRANETTATAIKNLLENGTYGLNALKTSVSNATKFNNTITGQIVLSKSLTKPSNVSTGTLFNETSSLFSVTGEGEILLFNYRFNNNTGNIGGTYSVSLSEVTIDGKNFSDDIFIKAGEGSAGVAAAIYDTLRFKFSKSFSCKLKAGYRWSSSAAVGNAFVLNEKINYLLQTK